MAHRHPQRGLARALAPMVGAALLGAGVARAANSTVSWQYMPGTGGSTEVPACHDANGMVLSVPHGGAASGTMKASLTFQGPQISLWGTRYDAGTSALIVVDGDYANAKYVDESPAGHEPNEAPNACVLLASFDSLSNNPRGHRIDVVLQGAPVDGASFTIANVTTLADVEQAEHATPSAGTSAKSKGPNMAAIIAPIVAVILLVVGGILLWVMRRRRRRNAKKAPSAAFRAEHPSLPMGNIHNANDGGQDEESVHELPRVPTSGGMSTSSGTLVSMSYPDEKRKLKDIMYPSEVCPWEHAPESADGAGYGYAR